MSDYEQLFEVPAERPGLDHRLNLILQLGALSGRLAAEERTLVNQPSGRAENVSEHANMLSRVATILAIEHYPNLDAGLVSQFATVHDDVEAYVGDTPTHNITPEGLAEKSAKEAAGIDSLKRDFARIPSYVRLIEAYEAQVLPEARFVRVIDKLMPLTIHFNEGGATLSSHWTSDELIENANAKVQGLISEYPEFSDTVSLLEDFALVASDELFGE